MTRRGAVGEGVQQLRATLRAGGPREVAQRVVRRAARRLDVASLDLPLEVGDIADSTRLALPVPSRRAPGTPLTIGWLTTPPAAGSGGHTTMFRMVRALEEAGHTCVVVLHDVHHGVLEQQARVLRASWPEVRAEIRSVDEGLEGLDACVATAWSTAHVLASRSAGQDLHRLYLVQDHEPFFYPRGSLHALAADTYRFGFTHLALGRMVHDRLASEVGVTSHLVPFSVDTSVYSLQQPGPRSGVVLYAKPDVPRRGFLLASLALQEFHRRRPEQEIHLYGAADADLDVPVVRHRRLTPVELNALYNRSAAGLAMSFTNISLVAEELLAAGCVPVVNDAPDARADLPAPHVAWAPPTPGGLADALCRAVDAQQQPDHARTLAAGVRRDDWRETARQVVAIVEGTVLGPAPHPDLHPVGAAAPGPAPHRAPGTTGD